MNLPVGDFHRFVRAVHRRHCWARIREGMAVGSIGGGVVAVSILVVAYVLHRSSVMSVIASIVIGAAGGMTYALLRLPKRFASAARADEQLRLADLLVTAYGTRDRTDAWTVAVRKSADYACRPFQPSAVIVHRWKGSAWGGLALSLALVIVLSLMTDGSVAKPDVRQLAGVFSASDRQTFHDSPFPTEQYRSSFKALYPAKDVEKGIKDELEPAPQSSASDTRPTPTVSDDIKRSNMNDYGTGDVGKGRAESKAVANSVDLPAKVDLKTTPKPKGDDAKSAVGGDIDGPGGSAASADGGGAHTSTADRSIAPFKASAVPHRGSSENAPAYEPYRTLIRAYFDPS